VQVDLGGFGALPGRCFHGWLSFDGIAFIVAQFPQKSKCTRK
jgi:hypothetical protein